MQSFPVILLSMFVCGTYAGESNSTQEWFDNGISNTTAPTNTGYYNETDILQVDSEIGPGIPLFVFQRKVIKMNYTLLCDHPSSAYLLIGKCLDEDVAYTEMYGRVYITCNSTFNSQIRDHCITNTRDRSYGINEITDGSESGEITNSNATFTVHGVFNMTFNSHMIGQTPFVIQATKVFGPGIPNGIVSQVHIEGRDDAIGNTTLNNTIVFKGLAIVAIEQTVLLEVMRPMGIATIVLVTLGMGVKINLDVMKDVLKKPIAPLVGLFCQYVCMPLIAYLIARYIPQKSAAMSLGTFACGVAPGGGFSNMASYQLGGDITLSMTMTTISSIMAFGMIPLWMSTLGQTFTDNSSFDLPFLGIFQSVCMITLPVIGGIFIKWKIPKLAKFISKYLGGFIIVVALATIGISMPQLILLMNLLKPQQILAGSLLPYIGFVIGGLIAFLTRRSWCHIKTIAIETGVQNVGIVSLMLFLSLPMPNNILAMVVPLASSLMTPLPLMLAMIVYGIYKKCTRKDEVEDSADETTDKEKELSSAKKATLWEKITGRNRDDKQSKWQSNEITVIENEDDSSINKVNVFISQTSVDGLINTKI